MDLSNFIYLEEKGFVFAYVPKVACTNWKCIFRYLIGAEDYLESVLAHDRVNSGLTYLNNVEGAQTILNDGSIKKFTFVRNPYSRILSAYRNKVESFGSLKPSNGVQDFWFKVNSVIKEEVPEGKNVTFTDFLNWLATSEHPFTKNEHWCSQSEIVHPCDVDFDFIGKFEDIGSDAAHILSEIDCDLNFPTQQQVRFPSTNATTLIRKYYSQAEYQLVNDLFHDDFKNFNYKKV